ncbi:MULTISPECIES: hypothetical protein [unclassified Moritella]|uniref:SGNH/GDSL hydrolase family protein n=1 Tax=unclassified Moritella TaxID=2637987 RepID=UPI001BA7CFC1|nr:MULTISPECIES: hypothetical protein [unclassified Moritella]QUM85340.1 hypothetical protein HWV02_12915 [Moritella sp. 28]QUM89572.1 hypothetical protein HWV03_12550 [Moritella sp. 36]
MIAYIAVLAEVFIRFLNPVPILPRYVSATDYGIRGNTQNADYQHVTEEYKINVKINSKGVRSDKDIRYEKSEGVIRVVTLGDSFMLGYGAQLSETFLSQMSNSIVDKHNVEIVNLGVSGHGTAEELIVLREEGKKYDPDIVLLSWHGTDYADNIRSGLFNIMNGSLIQVNDSYLPAVKLREYLFSFKIYEFIASNSQLYSWLRELVSEMVKNSYEEISSYFEFQPKISEEDNRNNFSTEDKKNELAIHLLLEIKKEVDDIGAKFIVLDIPRFSSKTHFRSTFPDDVRLVDILVYNPITDFNHYNENILYWEKSDGHFTPIGNQIVGKALADILEKNKYLD